MSSIEKSTFIFAAVSFSIWLLTLFSPITTAEVSEVNRLSFGTMGYPAQRLGNNYRGGGGFKLYYASYRYSVDGKKYDGNGIAKLYPIATNGYAPIKIRYFVLWPSLSFSSNQLFLYASIFLSIAGLGFMQIRLYVAKWL